MHNKRILSILAIRHMRVVILSYISSPKSSVHIHKDFRWKQSLRHFSDTPFSLRGYIQINFY